MIKRSAKVLLMLLFTIDSPLNASDLGILHTRRGMPPVMLFTDHALSPRLAEAFPISAVSWPLFSRQGAFALHRDPHTFEELFIPSAGHDQPLSFRLLNKGGNILYQPDSYSMSTDRQPILHALRTVSQTSGIGEAAFTQDLLAMDRANRRLHYHDKLDTYDIPGIMETDQLAVRISPRTHALEAWIEHPEFLRMIQDEHGKELLIGALLHEYGHLAGFLHDIILRDGFHAVSVPEALKSILPKEIRYFARAELLADLIVRRAVGERDYQYTPLDYLSKLRKYMKDHGRSIINSSIERIKQEFAVSLFMLTWIESLIDSRQKQDALEWLQIQAGQWASILDVDRENVLLFRHYYARLQESYVIREGIVYSSLQPLLEKAA